MIRWERWAAGKQGEKEELTVEPVIHTGVEGSRSDGSSVQRLPKVDRMHATAIQSAHLEMIKTYMNKVNFSSRLWYFYRHKTEQYKWKGSWANEWLHCGASSCARMQCIFSLDSSFWCRPCTAAIYMKRAWSASEQGIKGEYTLRAGERWGATTWSNGCWSKLGRSEQMAKCKMNMFLWNLGIS